MFSTATFIFPLLFSAVILVPFLEMAEQGLFEVSIAEPIRTEVERILTEKFLWPDERVHQAMSYIAEVANLIVPEQTVTDCTDPDDNRVLECALESHAAVVVTGDAHLLKLHPYREISILTPRQFLEFKPWQS